MLLERLILLEEGGRGAGGPRIPAKNSQSNLHLTSHEIFLLAIHEGFFKDGGFLSAPQEIGS